MVYHRTAAIAIGRCLLKKIRVHGVAQPFGTIVTGMIASCTRLTSLAVVLVGCYLLIGCKPEPVRLHYLANEGVAVFHGETTILFDPLFKESFETYHLPDAKDRTNLLEARAPFDAVDAVFVSHHHGDHFDPTDMIELLQTHENAQLYAPMQASDAMQRYAPDAFESIKQRIVGFDLDYDSQPQTIKQGTLLIEAFFVPHAGWPDAQTKVQNIAFRISLEGNDSISHFGDADPNPVHFERHRNTWLKRASFVALPPYWFFSSRNGKQILADYIRPEHTIGVHLPKRFKKIADLPEQLRDADVFLAPGDIRVLDHAHHRH